MTDPKLIPREPTPEMVEAERVKFEAWCAANGHGTLDDMMMPLDRSLKRLLWTAWQARAMHDAAPTVEAGPVAWMDDFGNAFPLAANKGAGSWLDEHKRNWKPLYTHPAAPQPAALPEARYTEDEIADACMLAEIPDSKFESLLLALKGKQ